MKSILLITLIFGLSIFYIDAFLSSPYHPRTKVGVAKLTAFTEVDSDTGIPFQLTHEDILWKLRPPPETNRFRKILLRLSANLLRLDCKVKGQDPPLVLCPKGRMALLEAYYKPPSQRRSKKIGRFGITVQRGPSAPPIEETIKDLYGIDLPVQGVGSAAIIYMFVEPDYRNKGVGDLALDVIATIHAIQGCDFTMLVADDKGSGKLVKWYETNGFSKAPKLQNLMGSPDGNFGVSMIAPTNNVLSESCRIKWW